MYRLTSTTLGFALILQVLLGASPELESLGSQYIHAVAPLMFPLKNDGTELQKEAFRNADLLVVYGSSELEIPNPYHASTVFATYPSGFTIFPVGRGLTTSLVMLQAAAAVGSELRGRKVVLSVSPAWFFLHDRPPEFYAANYSRLHLSSLVFSPDLSLATKRGAARQLQNAPKMLERDPLIAFAVNRLADGTENSEALYTVAQTRGQVENGLLHLQDAADTDQFLAAHSDLDLNISRQTADIDWQALIQQADQEQRTYADNNPFGFDNRVWTEKYARLIPERHAAFSDAWFAGNLQSTAEWTDLDLLLRGLLELGAQPLVISQPIAGKYYDYTGISHDARSEYYKRLRALVGRYGVPVVDFANHDDDEFFVTDPNSHLSRKGWVYYNQALDAFFHDNLDQLDPGEWSQAASGTPPLQQLTVQQHDLLLAGTLHYWGVGGLPSRAAD